MSETCILWCKQGQVQIYRSSASGESLSQVPTAKIFLLNDPNLPKWLDDNMDWSLLYILSDQAMDMPIAFQNKTGAYDLDFLKAALPQLLCQSGGICYIQDEPLFAMAGSKDRKVYLLHPTQAKLIPSVKQDVPRVKIQSQPSSRKETSAPIKEETLSNQDKSPLKFALEALYHGQSSINH